MSSPPAPPPVSPPEPGDPAEVGAYQVLGRLGVGGMGTVHLGRAADGRLAAIKIVHEELARDEEFRVRFAAEVANAQRVASFCTAQVLGQGELDGRPYLVTEYIDGDTLHQHVSRYGPLAPGTLQGVAVGVAAGLAAIHTAGLVHRDLKPANVILSVSGPRVIDFGIARALDVTSAPTPTGFIVGSPGWIAPEQLLNRQIGTFADIFSWACLMCYAGNARHPFGRGDAVTMAARILHAEPDLGTLADPLRGLVTRALSKDPADRPSALELMLAVVGGSTQGVERATEQLLSSQWHPADPDAPTPPDAAALPHAASPAPQAPPPDAAPPGDGPPDAALDATLDATPPQGAGAEDPTPPGAAPPAPTDAASPLARLVQDLGSGTGENGRYVPEAAMPTSVENPVVGDPGPPAAPRRRKALMAGLAVLVVLAGGGAAYALWPRDHPAVFRPVALGRTHPTDVGRPLHLGPADVTVGVPRCGPATYRGRTAQGRFCLVPLIAYNNPDSGRVRPVRLTPARLGLLDSGGGRHTPAAAVNGLAPGHTDLPTGARVAGDLLYDVPRGATPVNLTLVTTERGAAPGVTSWL